MSHRTGAGRHYNGFVVISARTAAWLVAIAIGLFAWLFYMKSAMPPGVVRPGDPGPHAHHAAATTRIVTTALDGDDVLYAVEAVDDRVELFTSRDGGRTYSEPVIVAAGEAIDANGEARPKVAIGPGGEVLVSWTRRGQALYTGDIRFARSTDGGRTFSEPVTINDDGLPIGHRFDSLGVAPDGTVVLAWIDKRDLERATAAGESYAGAAVYVAVSRDAGATFGPNRKVQDHSCECCRIAMAFETDSTPVLFWRHVLPGGIRDHVAIRLSDDAGEAVRIGSDNWQIDACPHHGPALAVEPDGRYHFAWFTGAEPTGPAVFYAYSDDRGRTTTAPLRIGSGALAGHPTLAVAGGRLWLGWKEWRDDGTTAVLVMSSDDRGDTWSSPRTVATSGPNSDRPFLIVTRSDRVLLSWADPDDLMIVPVAD